MRSPTAGLVLTLTLALSATAAAQSPTPVPSPSAAPTGAAGCQARTALLGGIGRASIVAFTGKIFGDHVCATVANLATDSFTASLGPSAAPQALVSAAVAGGTGAALSVGPSGSLALVPGAAETGSVAVGPVLIAPGGRLAVEGGDANALPRVVLAYAGQRVLVIGTSPVTLVDLARVLRDQPDLFGADAFERAVVLTSGPAATLSLQTDAGVFGSPPAAAQVLSLIKRG
ncbi:MAG TPA: hypothetical protein VE591_00870 [Candidatus Acidoferrum sp.]|nr:hypothetical protein [Candidatus Acidoferrum sp.]